MTPIPAAAIQPGETLVTSLCREMDRLRRRAGQVLDGLERCQDPLLFERLREELRQLGGRREELQRVAGLLRRRRQVQDSLALEFLQELTRRPLGCG